MLVEWWCSLCQHESYSWVSSKCTATCVQTTPQQTCSLGLSTEERRRPAAASGYSSSGHRGSAGPSLPGCLREFSLRFIYEHHQEMFTTSCVRFYLHHSWQWCWLGELVYSHSHTGCRVGGWEGSAVGICCWVTVGGRDGPVWWWGCLGLWCWPTREKFVDHLSSKTIYN